MATAAPGILVFEKKPRWESELKRRLMRQRVFIRGCRTVASIQEQLRARPGSVLLLDLEAGPADCLRLAGSILERRLPAFPIVVAPPGMAELEWPARELGAVDFVPDTIRGERLSRLCRRQLAGRVDEGDEIALWLSTG